MLNVPAPAPDPDRSYENTANPEPQARDNQTEGQVESGDVSQTTVDGVKTTIGSYNVEYSKPKLSHENLSLSGSLGSVAIDGTAFTKETELDFGPLDATGTLKVGTTNADADAKAAATVDGLKSNVCLDASIGGEVMGVDGKLEGSISVTTQGIADTAVETYNAVVDPIHETIVGHDVPDMRDIDLPDYLDRSVTLSGHIEGGLGISAKVGVEANSGKTGDRDRGLFSAGGRFKTGIGPVFGMGANVVIK